MPNIEIPKSTRLEYFFDFLASEKRQVNAYGAWLKMSEVMRIVEDLAGVDTTESMSVLHIQNYSYVESVDAYTKNFRHHVVFISKCGAIFFFKYICCPIRFPLVYKEKHKKGEIEPLAIIPNMEGKKVW